MKKKPNPNPSPQNLDSLPIARGGKCSARESGWGEGAASETLVVSEGPITPYLGEPQQPRHSRESGNPVPSERTTLGKALPIKYGKSKSDAYGEPADEVPVYGSSGQIGTFGRRLTGGATLIVGRKGSAGAVHYSPGPCWPIDTVYYAEEPKGTHLPFFRYLLEFVRLGRFDRSTAIPSLSRDDYNAIEVSIPTEDEQRRIVAELETQLTRLDASVTALKRVQANLKRYRASVLKDACEGRLVLTEAELACGENRTYETGDDFLARVLSSNTSGSRRRDSMESPDRGSLPPLPEGWTWAFLPHLGELNRGKSKHRPRDDERLYGGPYPFIQTGDIRKSAGTVREHSQTYSEFGLAQSRLWPTGTLCITIAANIAETGVLSYPACFPDSIVGFVHEGARETTRWVDLFLRTAKEKLERFAPATAQKNINLDVLRKVAVPLPPLAELLRIVAEVERCLSVIEELEATVAANLKRASRFRSGVLQAAFRPAST